MEKEALINIILNDLNEMHTLVSTFKGKPDISAAFLNLVRTKLNNIGEELNLLETLQGMETPVVNASESALTSGTSHDTPADEARQIAESSSRFANEEATQDVVPPTQETKPEPEIKPDFEVSKNDTEIINEPVVEKVDTATEPAPKATIAKPKVIIKEQKEAVLGEKINPDTKSLNEKIAIRKEGTHITQIGKPVDDVRKAIGINDRFYYQRELFGGNADLFNQTLDQLNQMQSFDAALQFIHSNYNWENDNEVAQSFLKNIQRRFI